MVPKVKANLIYKLSTVHFFKYISKILSYTNIIFSNKKKLLYFSLITILASVNQSFAALIFPSSLTDKSGTSSSQTLNALISQDQQGMEDVWENYIEFSGAKAKKTKNKASINQTGYSGVFQFNLPKDFNPATSTIMLHTNYRGPAINVQKWEFQLLNTETGKWITIADNISAGSWMWSSITEKVNDTEAFISEKNQILLRYTANNARDNSQLDYLALEINKEKPTPITYQQPISNKTTSDNVTAKARWRPVPGMKWHIQFTGTLDTSLNTDIFNIDVFDTTTSTISTLHLYGKHVICYLSAGSYENWRTDANKFPAEVLGLNLDGWPGEKWLDVRRLDILIPIMRARMELAAEKGCDAVDLDNVNGYTNKTGFPLTYSDQLAYNKALTQVAHGLGLAIGLKNNLDQINDLVNDYDFAVNEACFQYSECNLLTPFVKAGKPVFGIEYSLPTADFCPRANSMNFDFQKKNPSLDAWVSECR